MKEPPFVVSFEVVRKSKERHIHLWMVYHHHLKNLGVSLMKAELLEELPAIGFQCAHFILIPSIDVPPLNCQQVHGLQQKSLPYLGHLMCRVSPLKDCFQPLLNK